MKMQTIVCTLLLEIGKTSGHAVKWSITVMICWFPDVETFRPVIKSMAILWKGQSGISIICSGYICILPFPSCIGCNWKYICGCTYSLLSSSTVI